MKTPTTTDDSRESRNLLPLVLPLVGIVFVVLVAFFGYRWWTNEERAVRNRLDALAAVLTPPAGGGELAMVGRLAQLRNYFAPEVRIRFDADEIMPRDSLVALIGRWQPPPGGATIEFLDVTVVFTEKNTAQVSLTLKISNRDAQTAEPVIDAGQANLTMAKLDGAWVITSAERTATPTL